MQVNLSVQLRSFFTTPFPPFSLLVLSERRFEGEPRDKSLYLMLGDRVAGWSPRSPQGFRLL